MSSDIHIRPITIADAASTREAVAAVMRERRYLAFINPFSLEDSTTFIADNIRLGNPYWIALDRERVVGWCDIRRQPMPTYAHCGLLGMGVLAEYRSRGIGKRLLRIALAQAKEAGIERVELSVYAKNERARKLYEKVGFIIEGTRIRGKKLDGEYDDVHIMVYFT